MDFETGDAAALRFVHIASVSAGARLSILDSLRLSGCFAFSTLRRRSSAMRSEYREINELTVAMSRPKHLATSLSL